VITRIAAVKRRRRSASDLRSQARLTGLPFRRPRWGPTLRTVGLHRALSRRGPQPTVSQTDDGPSSAPGTALPLSRPGRQEPAAVLSRVCRALRRTRAASQRPRRHQRAAVPAALCVGPPDGPLTRPPAISGRTDAVMAQRRLRRRFRAPPPLPPPAHLARRTCVPLHDRCPYRSP
jgi:hypothetical protein